MGRANKGQNEDQRQKVDIFKVPTERTHFQVEITSCRWGSFWMSRNRIHTGGTSGDEAGC